MEASNINKYMIDDFELPIYPSNVTCQHNLVSKAWNDAWGEFHSVPINSKANITWKFSCLENDVLEQIHSYVMNKIKTSKKNEFMVNAFLSGEGWVKGKCYLGFPIKAPGYGASNDGKVPYAQYELYWTEIKGTVINQPGTVS